MGGNALHHGVVLPFVADAPKRDSSADHGDDQRYEAQRPWRSVSSLTLTNAIMNFHYLG